MTNVPVSLPVESNSARTMRHVLSVIVRDPLSLASTIIIVIFIFMAIFAYQIAPYPEEGAGKTHAANTLLAPSAEHWFGADKLGRDVLSRIIVGARPALIIPIGIVLYLTRS
jgi:peptide/nickel transport system permease protein